MALVPTADAPEGAAGQTEIAAPAGPAAKTCKCGHERHHPMVSANPQYSFIGWCAILTGISWEPRSAVFSCRRCGETIQTVHDPVELGKLRLYG